jgi:hypothetical protein
MTTANTRVRRIAAVGALVVAAAAVPALAELTVSTSTTTATGVCTAWFGSRGDGQCLAYSDNNVSIGTPQVGIGGPNSGSPGVGISTGPLLPGQTISIPMG